MRCKIGLQDGFPTAFAVKKPKDMDGLCSFIDLIKGQVALHRHKPDAKAGQKRVTDNRKASRELFQGINGVKSISQKIPCSPRVFELIGDITGRII